MDEHPKHPGQIATDEYALALGYLVREWNWLQNTRLNLFSTLLEPTEFSVSSAIWYKLLNDRCQRAILGAAAQQIFKPAAKSDPKGGLDPTEKIKEKYLSAIT
jgi:hypothetical protein